MNKYLIDQINLHHSMTAQDIVKLGFQSAFGVEHLTVDKNKSLKYFNSEYEEITGRDIPLYEEISENYVRVNMEAWKYKGYDKEKLFDTFLDSVNVRYEIDFKALMDEYISTLEEINRLDLKKDLILFLNDYYKTDMDAVHHSKIYEKNENPHYRVIAKEKLCMAQL